MCTYILGEGNGNPLQYSCLENPRDGGAWLAAVCGVAQSQARLKRLSSSSSTCIPSWTFTPAPIPPLWVITEPLTELPVLDSRFLLAICLIHGIDVYMSITVYQFSPTPTASIHPFPTSAVLFLPCKWIHLYHFSGFHVHALTYIWFSLSDFTLYDRSSLPKGQFCFTVSKSQIKKKKNPNTYIGFFTSQEDYQFKTSGFQRPNPSVAFTNDVILQEATSGATQLQDKQPVGIRQTLRLSCWGLNAGVSQPSYLTPEVISSSAKLRQQLSFQDCWKDPKTGSVLVLNK